MTKGNQAQKLFEKAAEELKIGQYQAAKKSAHKLVKMDKNNFSAWHLMAVIHGHLEDVFSAETAFNKAILLAPASKERTALLEQLVKFLIQFNRLESALKYLTQLKKLMPERRDIAYLLADVYLSNKNYQHALAIFNTLVADDADNIEVLKGLAQCHYCLGDIAKSVEIYQQLASSNNADINVIKGLTQCFIDLNDVEQAEAVLLKALLTVKDREADEKAIIHYQLALMYRDFGYLDKAQFSFENALELAPDAATIYYNYSRIKKFTKGDSYITQMQTCLSKLHGADLSPEQINAKTELLFALGKVSEDCEDYEQAFSYWTKANQLKRASYQYNIADEIKRVEVLKKCVSKTVIDRVKIKQNPDFRPIFIVGMPRAGSTLVEQILSSHSKVSGLGELTIIPELMAEIELSTSVSYPRIFNKINSEQLIELQDRYIGLLENKIDQSHFTDKLPGNFWFVGMIKAIFPNAIIINAKRDVQDTCFSCFKHLFSGSQKFAYDLKELKQYYQVYEQLMAFWQTLFPDDIYDLHYEQLVSEPQKTVEALLGFCQLPYQQECLGFYKTKRAVRTSSAAQIRQKLHHNAVGAWQYYQDQLGDVLT